MAKKTQTIALPDAHANPVSRNNKLFAWLGGAGNPRDIRSITWIKETKQWIVLTVKDAS